MRGGAGRTVQLGRVRGDVGRGIVGDPVLLPRTADDGVKNMKMPNWMLWLLGRKTCSVVIEADDRAVIAKLRAEIDRQLDALDKRLTEVLSETVSDLVQKGQSVESVKVKLGRVEIVCPGPVASSWMTTLTINGTPIEFTEFVLRGKVGEIVTLEVKGPA